MERFDWCKMSHKFTQDAFIHVVREKHAHNTCDVSRVTTAPTIEVRDEIVIILWQRRTRPHNNPTTTSKGTMGGSSKPKQCSHGVPPIDPDEKEQYSNGLKDLLKRITQYLEKGRCVQMSAFLRRRTPCPRRVRHSDSLLYVFLRLLCFLHFIVS